MKRKQNVSIPVGDVLEALTALKKAGALTRSRGVRRALSAATKRIKLGAGGSVSVPKSSWLKVLAALAGLVKWSKDIIYLARALMAK